METVKELVFVVTQTHCEEPRDLTEPLWVTSLVTRHDQRQEDNTVVCQACNLLTS